MSEKKVCHVTISRLQLPSPAVSIVGRHNSGKTTLVVKLISELTARGIDVGSIKHHGHAGFDIDIPGKDSYRHRQAGAAEVVIAAPGQIARICDVAGEVECSDLVAEMPGHDIVLVEGYRKSGLPSIEIMRAGNVHDDEIAELFRRNAYAGVPLTSDFVQAGRASQGNPAASDAVGDPGKMPTSSTVAVVSDIPAALEGAARYGIPSFGLGDAAGICDFLQERFMRQRISVVIQAGGESKRMGRSKATVPFLGRPLIVRMVERMLPVADELIVTTNEAEDLAFLADAYPGQPIRLVPDILPVRGALPGVLTALSAAKNEYVAIIACDMLFASARLIAAESAELSRTLADAVVPVNKHGYEPMHSLYRKSTCLPAAQRLVEGGDLRAQSLFEHIVIAPFTQPRVLRAEPMGGCFVNVNTPAELHAAEEYLLANETE
ncbi:molybdopterin-guanine dinucleotide biosynthesis protein B [Curtanaerobium respiraculi]|uniref:molybdopterin-guanine dinucleotide biosynthesis protein B n=1 Tax=Curtanaerobium respiraculi TaxID=2949669 RepID=UPI0024B39A6D|nr:molybdopterin-guanine dinucleotide biosynthesis protein B [Curtanaerobium respiraculi]